MPDNTADTAPRFTFLKLHVLSHAWGFTLWLYKAPDTPLDDMIVPSFFNNAGDMLAAGDMIALVGKDGGRIVSVVETGVRVVTGALV